MVDFRKANQGDREFYINSVNGFYNSDAVLHSIPIENIERTFEVVMGKSPFAEIYIMEQEGVKVGYALLAKTYSQESGREVIWLEEIYVLPQFQGKGIGGKFLEYLKCNYDVSRLRLEYTPINDLVCKIYKKHGFQSLEYKQMICGK